MSDNEAPASKTKHRHTIASVDIFIALMIIVSVSLNYPVLLPGIGSAVIAYVISLLKIIFIAIAVIFIKNMPLDKAKLTVIRKITAYFIFLAILNILSTIINGEFSLKTVMARTVIIAHIACLCNLIVARYDGLSRSLKGIKIASIIILLSSLFVYFFVPEVGQILDRGKLCLRGVLANQNAIIRSVMALITVLATEYSYGNRQISSPILITLAVFAIFATGSMTSLVVLAVFLLGIVLGMFFKKHLKAIAAVFSVVCVAIWIVFGIMMVNNSSFSFVSDLFDNRNATLTGRTYIWQKSIYLIEQKPLIGYGQDTHALREMSNYMIETTATDNTHNGLLGHLIVSGVIGCGVVLFIIYRFFVCSLTIVQKNPHSFFIVMLCIATLFRGLTENAMTYVFPFFVVFPVLVFIEYYKIKQADSVKAVEGAAAADAPGHGGEEASR